MHAVSHVDIGISWFIKIRGPLRIILIFYSVNWVAAMSKPLLWPIL